MFRTVNLQKLKVRHGKSPRMNCEIFIILTGLLYAYVIRENTTADQRAVKNECFDKRQTNGFLLAVCPSKFLLLGRPIHGERESKAALDSRSPRINGAQHF